MAIAQLQSEPATKQFYIPDWKERCHAFWQANLTKAKVVPRFLALDPDLSIIRCMPHCLFGLIVTVSCAALASAQEIRGFGDTDKREIEQMFDRYGQAVVAKDYATLQECVQAPFVLFIDSLQTLESMEAVLAFYRNLRESLEKRGYDHSEILQARITPLTADHALINAAYRRYKKDGSLLEEQSTVYPVDKTSGTWKLRGAMRQDLKYFGKVY